jgi:hypothetical protein
MTQTKGGTMKLTKLEADILSHRLEISDAIADCLSETFGYDHQIVDDRAYELCERLAATQGIPKVECELDAEILADALEGSTYAQAAEYACYSDGEITPQAFGHIVRAAHSLEAKMRVHTGNDEIFIELG